MIRLNTESVRAVDSHRSALSYLMPQRSALHVLISQRSAFPILIPQRSVLSYLMPQRSALPILISQRPVLLSLLLVTVGVYGAGKAGDKLNFITQQTDTHFYIFQIAREGALQFSVKFLLADQMSCL